MTLMFRTLTVASIALLAACAHPISIAPDLSKVDASASGLRPKTVGLYMPAAEKSSQATTPGGGGDKVSYYPYRDLEGGLYKMLGNVFEKVVVVSSPNDLESLVRGNVAYVVQPRIITQSSSDSLVTWPPTFFQIQLSSTFTDAGGTKISEVSVTGVGNATFSEFSGDFSLAAKRASLDVLAKAQKAISEDPKLK